MPWATSLATSSLQITAKVIVWNLRVMDFAARYRGDEFIILMPHVSPEPALIDAERIRSQFVLRWRASCPPTRVTLNMGIASVQHNHPTNSGLLVAMAEKAYARQSAKERIRYWCLPATGCWGKRGGNLQ